MAMKMMRGGRRNWEGGFVVRGRRRGGRWDAVVSVVGRLRGGERPGRWRRSHRRQDAVALAPAILLCMGLLPPAKEEGGGVPLPMILLLLLLRRAMLEMNGFRRGGWGGGGRQARDGGDVRHMGSPQPRRPPLHSPPLFPLLAETAPQSFRYDAAGGGGVHQWNNLWFCWCLIHTSMLLRRNLNDVMETQF